MGCRADDITKYNTELDNLNTALSEAQKLVGYTGNVSAGLDSLKGYYGSSVNASDEFINEFDELDKDADTKATSIQTKIEEAIEIIEGKLKDAESEEESCEIHHPG